MLHRDVRVWLEGRPPQHVVALAGASGSQAPDSTENEIAHAFVCSCGAARFRVLAVPVAMAGDREPRGPLGFVVRAMSRVWRELGDAANPEERVEALAPPIAIDCESCGRRRIVVPGEDPEAPLPPLEAHRCRPCRRSSFQVVARYDYAPLEERIAPEPGDEERFDRFRLGVWCSACGHGTDDLYVVERRDTQRRVLDQLYGREPGG